MICETARQHGGDAGGRCRFPEAGDPCRVGGDAVACLRPWNGTADGAVLRQTVVAMRLGAAAGMDQAACTSTYYTSLLAWVGCAVDTTELAAVFGDKIGLYADTRDEDLERVTLAVFVARHLGRGQSGFRRIGLVGKFLATAGRSVQQLMESHCRVTSDLAERLGLGRAVCEPLLQTFERWDGKGVPGSVGAGGLAPAIRLVHLADAIGGRFRTRSRPLSCSLCTTRAQRCHIQAIMRW